MVLVIVYLLTVWVISTHGTFHIYHTFSHHVYLITMSQVVGLPNKSYKPNTNTAWVRTWPCKLQKGALDSQPQVINLPVVCPWSVVLSGTPASSTTKTGHHDMVEILLKVALNTIKSNHNHCVVLFIYWEFLTFTIIIMLCYLYNWSS